MNQEKMESSKADETQEKQKMSALVDSEGARLRVSVLPGFVFVTRDFRKEGWENQEHPDNEPFDDLVEADVYGAMDVCRIGIEQNYVSMYVREKPFTPIGQWRFQKNVRGFKNASAFYSSLINAVSRQQTGVEAAQFKQVMEEKMREESESQIQVVEHGG
jgi:hypothetical protein